MANPTNMKGGEERGPNPWADCRESERLALEALDQQLSAFVEEFAGTRLDIDPVIEAASVEATHSSSKPEKD
jgi:hypothetical protein